MADSGQQKTVLKSASWGSGDGTVLPTIVATVAYTSIDADRAEKTVVREQVWRRFERDEAAIQSRKQWARFGSAKGHVGLERGVSMTSPDMITIEDPLGEEAQQSGEDKMIERLKQSVKHRNNSDHLSPARSRTPLR
jgi:hypothetical protein